MRIDAKGTAVIDGVHVTWQEVSVDGGHDTIYEITFGKYTVRAVKEEFMRLLKHPEDYYAVPEYPRPMSMKAAIVAVNTIWGAESINIDGEMDADDDVPTGEVVF